MKRFNKSRYLEPRYLDDVVDRIFKGESVKSIAKALDQDTSAIYSLLSRHGISLVKLKRLARKKTRIGLRYDLIRI